MLRKILFFACLLVRVQQSFAQVNTAADSLQLDINHVVQPLDKSVIPTGMLEEYGLGMLPLNVFNGILNDSNVVNANIWRGLYASIYTSRIYGTNTMATLPVVNALIKSQVSATGDSLPLMIMDYNYAAIRPDAASANLLRVQNGQLFDVAGRTTIPYIQRTCFAAAPARDWSKGQPSFLLKSNLYYSNRGKTVASIGIDFGDGQGYRTAAFNGVLTAAYTTNGKHRITIRVNYTDNTAVNTYSDFNVTNLSGGSSRYPSYYDDIQSFYPTSAHSGATVYINYSSNNTSFRIKKPLIVVEGYDVSSVAPDVQSNYSYSDFIAGINAPGASYDFNNQLDLANYDLIFVDFRNGTDDIVRNAALVKDVITWVNQQKATAGSTEQNVVLGLSMGGLVARYALANMTKQSINTGTRLLLTHDSPHRGANLPIGIQHLITALNYEQFLPQGMKISDMVPELSETQAIADAPATKQLLLVRSVRSGGIYQTQTNTFLDNDYRNMITFPTGGPQPTYRLATTSLGSQCGQQVLSPGTKLIDIHGKFRLSVLIFRANYYLDLNAWALNNTNTSAAISNIKFSTNKTLLFIPISRTLFSLNISVNTVQGNLTAWDGVPGGTQSTLTQVGSVPSNLPPVTMPVLFFTAKIVSELNVAPGANFTFVPTVSALDIATINNASLSGKYTGGYSTYNSRAATFIAQEAFTSGSSQQYNKEHIAFTPRNAQWMYNEMQNIANTLNCSSECSVVTGSAITGPTSLCGTQTYQVTNIPPGHTVSWTASPAGVVNIVNNGSSLTVTQVAGNAGVVTLTGTISNLCATITSAPINVGPQPVTDYSPYLDVISFAQPVLEINNFYGVANASAYYLYVDGVLKETTSSAGDVGHITGFLDYCTHGYYAIGIRAQTTCGLTPVYNKYVYPPSCSPFFSATPNPAASQVVIKSISNDNNTAAFKAKANTATASPAFISSIKIVDGAGTVVKTITNPRSQQTQLTIDVSDLPGGIYYFQVFSGKTSSTVKVFVQH